MRKPCLSQMEGSCSSSTGSWLEELARKKWLNQKFSKKVKWSRAEKEMHWKEQKRKVGGGPFSSSSSNKWRRGKGRERKRVKGVGRALTVNKLHSWNRIEDDGAECIWQSAWWWLASGCCTNKETLNNSVKERESNSWKLPKLF